MIKNILLVKSSAIGDVIQTFPVLSYLHQKFPSARIDWVVEKVPYALVAAHPLVHRALMIDTKKWRCSFFKKENRHEMGAFRKKLTETTYDVIFDLQGNTKSGVITLMASGRDKVGFSWDCVAEKPNVIATYARYRAKKGPITEKYLSLVRDYFSDPAETPFIQGETFFSLSDEEKARLAMLLPKREGPFLLIAFGAKWRNKRLTEETLQKFLERIAEKIDPYFFFTWSSSEEKEIADRLFSAFPNSSSSIGKLSLPLWQSLMREMDGVISMDSAALHLCATTKTPTFSIFGPSNPDVYKPVGEDHYAFQGACPYGKVFESRCPILRSCSTGACMHDLSSETLFSQFLIWWE